jgi:hypothetical protein
MNRVQKKAVVRLTVVVVLVAISAVILLLNRQLPILDVLGSLGFGWIIFIPALIGPPPFIPFRKKGPVVFDERDSRIVQRATEEAFGAFWYVFPVICMFLYLYISASGGKVNAAVLTIMAGGGEILVTLVQSISILVQYQQGNSNGDK